jgi:hypothetical protein
VYCGVIYVGHEDSVNFIFPAPLHHVAPVLVELVCVDMSMCVNPEIGHGNSELVNSIPCRCDAIVSQISNTDGELRDTNGIFLSLIVISQRTQYEFKKNLHPTIRSAPRRGGIFAAHPIGSKCASFTERYTQRGAYRVSRHGHVRSDRSPQATGDQLRGHL